MKGGLQDGGHGRGQGWRSQHPTSPLPFSIPACASHWSAHREQLRQARAGGEWMGEGGEQRGEGFLSCHLCKRRSPSCRPESMSAGLEQSFRPLPDLKAHGTPNPIAFTISAQPGGRNHNHPGSRWVQSGGRTETESTTEPRVLWGRRRHERPGDWAAARQGPLPQELTLSAVCWGPAKCSALAHTLGGDTEKV